MIRVLLPDMPAPRDLLPYLESMERSKQYVNGGPLVRELEVSIAEMLGVAQVAATSNGTTALELALRAMELPQGSYVAVPAATFVATGLAVVNAGLRPVLCDTSPASDWQLTPEDVAMTRWRFGQELRAAVPVATFGKPVDALAWDTFAESIGFNVVIDAAGALTTQAVPQSVLCAASFSMHATKFVPAGEGGLVASCDPRLVERVEEMATFGPGGTNARMSEYHAAVGLCSLESLKRRRIRMLEVLRWYEELLPPWLKLYPCEDRTLLVALLPPGLTGPGIDEFMELKGVQVKRWYRPFLDELPQFEAPGYFFTGTERLRQSAVGLPFHRFLTQQDVATVVGALKRYEESC